MSDRQWKSREIVERIVVEGDLILLTPTSLGSGDRDGLTDISLLLDEYAGSALLTGTSIAGALRNYLREREKGFGKAEDNSSICRKLFGWHEDEGAQSCLIIDDAFGNSKPTTELRDGVRIEGKTRTAFIDKHGHGSKFDLELLEAGTIFKLRFELLILEGMDREGLIQAFASALQGFENGEIHLGARKRRGYGECEVRCWTVKRYNLQTKNGLLAWLGLDKAKLKNVRENEINESQKESVAEGMKASCALVNDIKAVDNRELFEMTACFALDGSMLIRSGSRLQNVPEQGQPDTVHLRSKHKGKGYVPVVSGTSLAGVLRHRAVKICNTLTDDSGEHVVEQIFGVDMEKLKERNKANSKKEPPFASRLEVKETFIENTNDHVHTRVKIDRFTGGAFEGALFDAAPVFSSGDKQALTIKLKLRNPKSCEIGLLLLLLKDLWTSDLVVGGESSIGRGRLQGLSAALEYRKGAGSWRIEFGSETDKPELVQFTAEDLPTNTEKKTVTEFLNDFVTALNEQLGNSPKGGVTNG